MIFLQFLLFTWAFVVLSTSSEELGTRHQTPTLIGCIFLRILQPEVLFVLLSLLRSAKPWILTRFLKSCQTLWSLSLRSESRSTRLNHRYQRPTLSAAKPWSITRFFDHLANFAIFFKTATTSNQPPFPATAPSSEALDSIPLFETKNSVSRFFYHPTFRTLGSNSVCEARDGL